jgi:hypothetical protein
MSFVPGWKKAPARVDGSATGFLVSVGICCVSAVVIGIGLFPIHSAIMDRISFGIEVPAWQIGAFLAALWVITMSASKGIFEAEFAICASTAKAVTRQIAGGYALSFAGTSLWFFWGWIAGEKGALLLYEAIALATTAVFAVTAAAAHFGARWGAYTTRDSISRTIANLETGIRANMEL